MRKAFSLIETLIAITLVALISAFAVINTNYSNRLQSVDSATEEIRQALKAAKANALNAKKDCVACGATTTCGTGDAPLYSWRVYFSYVAPGPGTYYMEGRCGITGATSFWTSSAAPAQLPTAATINTGGATWVEFRAVDGRAANSLGSGSTTFTISATGITPQTVVVTSGGQIQ